MRWLLRCQESADRFLSIWLCCCKWLGVRTSSAASVRPLVTDEFLGGRAGILPLLAVPWHLSCGIWGSITLLRVRF
jgi:hypothetical protein